VFGDPAEMAQVEESVREVATRLGLSVGDSTRVLARVAIDLRDAPVSVVVTDGKGAVIVRRGVPRPTSGEVLREELAVIVADALDAARAVEAARAEPALPPPVVAVEAPPASPANPPASAPLRADVTGFLVGRGRDSSAYVVLGAGLGARVAAGGDGVRPTLSASGDASIPYDASTRDVELRVSTYSLRLAPGLTTRVGRTVDLEAMAGLGLDVVHVAPRAPVAGVSPGESTTRASPVLAPAIGARFRLGSAQLTASAGLDVDLARRRYVLATPQGTDEAWRSWAVHPVVSVGVSLPFAGGEGDLPFGERRGLDRRARVGVQRRRRGGRARALGVRGRRRIGRPGRRRRPSRVLEQRRLSAQRVLREAILWCAHGHVLVAPDHVRRPRRGGLRLRSHHVLERLPPTSERNRGRDARRLLGGPALPRRSRDRVRVGRGVLRASLRAAPVGNVRPHARWLVLGAAPDVPDESAAGAMGLLLADDGARSGAGAGADRALPAVVRGDSRRETRANAVEKTAGLPLRSPPAMPG
jgi:hypothetical protein